MKISRWSACVLMLGAGMAVAQAPEPVLAPAVPALPAGLSAVRSLGGVSEYQLDNGLQLLLMPGGAQRMTIVNMVYRVGSRHEGPGESGMAHLLEHMTFHGSREHGEIGTGLRGLAARFNGTTTMDRTSYVDSFEPAEGRLRQVLALEAARMREASLQAEDFEKEKPVVLNELGLRGAATPLQMQQALNAGAFRIHPYGRPVVGFTADIENLSLPTLRAFYERHYRPDNAVLVISGSFDPGEALAAVAATLGPIARPALPPAPLEQVEPTQPNPRQMTVRTRETALAVGYRVPGVAHPHAPAVAVLAALMAGVPSKLTRTPTMPVQQALVAGTGTTRDPFMLGLIVQAPTRDSGSARAREALEDVEEEWLRALEQTRRYGQDAAAVRRVATGMGEALRKVLQDPARFSALMADAVGAGDWRLPFKVADGLGSISAGEVQAAADLYIRRENRTVVRGVTDPEVKGAEFKELPITGFASLFSRTVEVPSVQDPSGGIGELKAGAGAGALAAASDIDPAALDQATRLYRLPSGVLLGMLQKDLPEERVVAHLSLRWGRPEEMARQKGWRALGGLLEAGTARHSAAQILQIKKNLQLELRVLSTPQQVGVVLSTRKAQLLPALLFVKELLSEPLLDAKVFARQRDEVLARLAPLARGQANTAGERERQHHNRFQDQHPGDPGYQAGPADALQAWQQLGIDEVRGFQQRYWSANRMSLAVVGHVPSDMAEGVEAVFGAWKKPEAPLFEHYAPRHQPEPGARFVSQSAEAGGAEAGAALVVLHQEVPLNIESDDFYAAMLGLRVLAGNGAASGTRLADRLRGREALSYSVGSRLRVAAEGNRAGVRLQASGAPAAVARIEALMKEEVERALADGFTDAEIEQARQQFLVERRQQFGNDAALAVALLTQLERDIDFSTLQRREDERLAAVTPEAARLALRRLLRTDAWVVVISGARL